MEELILLVVLVVTLLWVKNKFIEPEKSKKIDIFLNRGVTYAKRLFSKASGKTASIDKTSEIEKTETHQVPVQQTIVDLKQEQVEILQNINVSPTKNITNTVDSCQKQNDKTPEDSMLRRHFMTQLQAKIESSLFPRPTDSTLKRHYDNLVRASVAELLAK